MFKAAELFVSLELLVLTVDCGCTRGLICYCYTWEPSGVQDGEKKPFQKYTFVFLEKQKHLSVFQL